MTQAQLAEKAGLSEVLVKKLEQGVHEGIRLTTLYALAEALGVPPGYLLDGARDEAEGDIVKEPDPGLLLPLRRLLLPAGQPGGSVDDEEGLTFASLRKRVLGYTEDFNHARYVKVATGIPDLIVSIEAAIGLHENEAKAAMYRLLAHAYILTAQTLINLRGEDLACQAVGNAMDAAEGAGDPVLRASAAENYTWAFTRQGMYDAAETVAVDMAAEIEPSMTKAAPEHLAVWGRLLRSASRAAAYNNRPDAANEHLSLAHMAAVRIDGGGMDYGKYWAVLTTTMIGSTKAENALIEGDANLALRHGRGVQRTGNTHLDNWTWYLLVMADAQASTRDYAGAIGTMKTIRRLAPEWVKNHRVAHEVARRLLDATSVRRAKSSGLADLVAFMGVEP